jgi:hypothetical protein
VNALEVPQPHPAERDVRLRELRAAWQAVPRPLMSTQTPRATAADHSFQDVSGDRVDTR